jgi:hypothetical protein
MSGAWIGIQKLFVVVGIQRGLKRVVFELSGGDHGSLFMGRSPVVLRFEHHRNGKVTRTLVLGTSDFGSA